MPKWEGNLKDTGDRNSYSTSEIQRPVKLYLHCVMCLHVEARGGQQDLSFIGIHLCFETRSLLESEQFILSGLAGQ